MGGARQYRHLFGLTKLKMLRFYKRVTRMGKIRSEYIRGTDDGQLRLSSSKAEMVQSCAQEGYIGPRDVEYGGKRGHAEGWCDRMLGMQ